MAKSKKKKTEEKDAGGDARAPGNAGEDARDPISPRAQKAYGAAMARPNRMVAADRVTQDELVAAGLAERTPAGDVYATEKRSAESPDVIGINSERKSEISE